MPKTLPPKIVGVGFQKTGTSSLRDALRLLGYSVGDNNHQMLWPILRGNVRRVLRKVATYEAVEDNPWPLIYPMLDEHIPGSKFVLTIRDPESWYKSVNRHIGDLRDPMHEWIYGRGKGLPCEDKANTLAVYNAHNEGVLAYFKDRPDDLLVLDIAKGEGWEPLCKFLGCPVPAAPFPHANNKLKEPKGPPLLEASAQGAQKARQVCYSNRVRPRHGLVVRRPEPPRCS